MFKYLSTFVASVFVSLAVVGVVVHTNTVDLTPARQATYTVELGYTENSIMGSCSGVLIKEHILLTAAHCNAPYIKVAGKAAILIKIDEQKDLLLLRVEALCPCVPVADGQVFTGDSVITVGYPFGNILGFTSVLTKGVVQGVVQNSTYPEIEGHMLMVLPVAPGNSGGGIFKVFNGKLYVISVCSRGAAHLATSPTIDMVKEFTKSPY
jgi:S1-C subfamily serine protease